MIIAFDRKGSPFSQGSGFILTAGGLAGSNYHVIKGAARAFASSPDGRVYDVGRIEGADLDKDLVVFQLYPRGSKQRAHDLSHVTLGSSSNFGIGERVIAIGSPQGLETVSDGILSAVREVDGTRFLQITAPVSPGSSGGPVLNSAGQMIGVATFQFNKGQNLNFAVAVDHLKPLLEQHLQLSFSEFQAILGRQAKRSPELATEETSSSPNAKEQLGHPSIASNSHYLLVAGQFGGVIHNQSANVSAQFTIFSKEDAGQLSGCMLVFQPLFGSGPLEGYVEGDTILFSVTSAIGKITAWGRRAKDEISGTYVVEHAGYGSNEEGSFTLHRVNSNPLPAEFDPSTCPSDAEVHK
jgi:S1-C subfamily serine protease